MPRNNLFAMRYYLVIFAVLLALSSCRQKGSIEREDGISTSNFLRVDYAQGFTIAEKENGFILTVTNPWQDAQGVHYKYFFDYHKSKHKEKDFNEAIPIPVNRLVCLSTTHIAYIDRLEASNAIVGVSGAGFVSNLNVRERINNGFVKDVGYEQALNYELLVSLKPDVVLAYGVGAEMAGYLQKLRDLKIPVVFVGDYLEENPLGKAEWLKVFGLMLGKYPQADSLFNRIAQEYNNTKGSLPNDLDKPRVFLNLPWKDVWYFPGGQGYMANLIADAGGNYCLSHLKGTKSYPFSVENALEYAAKSDVWLNTGMVNSLSEIENDLPIVKRLPILSSGRVYNNNNRVNATGGNDFWESGVVNPHLILKDLIKIFHPNHLEYDLVYYKQLQ
jgi:iron complex transport system substrate-binding protein